MEAYVSAGSDVFSYSDVWEHKQCAPSHIKNHPLEEKDYPDAQSSKLFGSPALYTGLLQEPLFR